MKRSFCLLLILSFLFVSDVYGQTFTLKIPYDTVYLGNTVTLTFSAENVNGEIQLDLQDLPIISGPNHSSSTTMINGEFESNKSVSYVIEPVHAGYLEIPAAYLNSKDEVYETMPVSILVLENPDGITQNDRLNIGGFSLEDQFTRKVNPYRRPITKKRKLKKI